MSDTISDVSVSKETYVDLNTLSGIVAGTAIVVENKSTVPVLLQIAAAQPSADSTDGSIIHQGGEVNSIKIITAGENTLWAKSIGRVDSILNIQDNT